jgi:hypothetical protein
VAALAVNLNKIEALECCQHLPPGQQRELHSESATTSWVSSSIKSFGDGSR